MSFSVVVVVVALQLMEKKTCSSTKIPSWESFRERIHLQKDRREKKSGEREKLVQERQGLAADLQ